MFKARYIRLILLLTVFTGILACDDKIGSNIPNVSFRVQLNLNAPEYATLKTDGNAITLNTISKTGQRAGYRGLIIIKNQGQYYAFDRCCPHHFVNAHPEDKIQVIADGALATCPFDESNFILLDGFGFPTDNSVAEYPLKRYQTSLSGSYLSIYN